MDGAITVIMNSEQCLSNPAMIAFFTVRMVLIFMVLINAWGIIREAMEVCNIHGSHPEAGSPTNFA